MLPRAPPTHKQLPAQASAVGLPIARSTGAAASSVSTTPAAAPGSAATCGRRTTHLSAMPRREAVEVQFSLQWGCYVHTRHVLHQQHFSSQSRLESSALSVSASLIPAAGARGGGSRRRQARPARLPRLPAQGTAARGRPGALQGRVGPPWVRARQSSAPQDPAATTARQVMR